MTGHLRAKLMGAGYEAPECHYFSFGDELRMLPKSGLVRRDIFGRLLSRPAVISFLDRGPRTSHFLDRKYLHEKARRTGITTGM